MLRFALLSRTPLPFPSVHPNLVHVTLLSLLSLGPLAGAAPVDPLVRNGAATFAVNGNVFTVTNSPGTIIDWRQFNVANGELLRFLQQNAQSTVLNRVTGNDPSQILGALQSNGRVLLVNPNGVLFGANAVVDVAGLVVSGLRLSDADFLSGQYHFNGAAGAVSNLGSISTPLGGNVYLIGGEVSNSGVIRAPGGQILLAAGRSVSLADSGTPNLSVTLSAQGNKALNLGELNAAGGRIDMYGALVDQQGIVRADSSEIDAQGRIVLKASNQTSVAGTLSAASATGVGGNVQVLGDQVTLSSSARIDASGVQGGGTVLVGGDYQGANAAVQNASATTVEAGASIDASARNYGNGGKVVVWSNGLTRYDGQALVRGGTLGGNGGLVETSGHTLRNHGTVDSRAPKGLTGNWLLDPSIYCFYNISAVECGLTTDSTVDAIGNIGSYLATSNATLQASNYISFMPAGGDATVDPTIPTGNTLTVLAPYIEIGRGAWLDTSSVGLALNASGRYGRTTLSNASGTNLTGSISIGGILTSHASQSLTADGGNLQILAENGVHYAGLRMTAVDGTQTLTATKLIEIGVDGTQAGSNYTADVSSAGKQTLTANSVLLRGSNASGGTDNSASLSSQAEQTISATDITIAAGGAGSASILMIADGATQTVKASTLALRAGDAGRVNYAGITTNGLHSTQQISASQSLTLVGGGIGGVTNGALINSYGSNADMTATQQTVNAGAMIVKGGATAGTSAGDGNFALVTTTGIQNVNAASIAIQGGSSQQLVSDGVVSSARISAATSQTITTSGALTVTGGTGAGHSQAGIDSQGSQTIKAGSLTVAAGNAGVDNGASLSANTNQTLVVDGELVIQGGAGGQNNNASVRLNGAVDGLQSVSAGKLSLLGGSSGEWNFAQLEVQGTRVSQAIKADSLLLQGGTGSNNWAHLWNDYNGTTATKQRIDAGSITLLGGGITPDSPDGRSNNDVALSSNGIQEVVANSVAISAGVSSATMQARTDQNVTIAEALTIRGGSSGAGSVAQLMADANQTVSAATIDIHGGNTGSNNIAGIIVGSSTANGNVQKITATTLTLTGGDAGVNNSARVIINGANNISQQIAATDISMTGGLSGAGNFARMNASSNDLASSEQTINARTLTLTGRGSGADDINDRASIYGSGNQNIFASKIVLQTGTTHSADAGISAGFNQTITATDSLSLTAGTTNGASAFIQQSLAGDTSVGTQTISSNQILLTAASQGNNGHARIYSNAIAQSINLTGSNPELVLTGGTGPSNSISEAAIYYDGTGSQTITINGGGSVKLLGGSGHGLTDLNAAAGNCIICLPDGNSAFISAFGGGNQTLDFKAGGSLTLTGGSNGSGNGAAIVADLSKGAQQTITSSGGAVNYPSIVLIGGSGGYYNVADGVAQTNSASIGSLSQLTAGPASALKTINAKAITLNGGGTSNTHGGALLGTGQGAAVINVTGDLIMMGGASNVALLSAANPATAYSVDQGAIAAINPDGKLTLTVGGKLNMLGGTGSSSGALISSLSDQNISATDIMMAGGSAGGANITVTADGATQTIKATTLALEGGSAGRFNFADIAINGLHTTQQINVSQSLTLTGGSAGSANGAMIEANGAATDATATVQNISAGVLTVKGGATAGASAGDGNFAALSSSGAQTISAASIAVQGGSSQQLVTDGVVSSAQISAATRQDITASGALSVTGGGGAGHSIASINNQGSQTITAASVTLAGAKQGIGNSADITSTQSQTLVVGGALTIQGGAGGSDNLAALNLSASVDGVQSISAGSLSLLGGSGGAGNFAQLESHGTRVSQTIKANALLLQGGSGNNNWAHLWNDYNGATVSKQQVDAASITLTGGSVNLDAPTAQSNNDAVLASNGSQAISATSVAIGAAGSSASIQAQGDQSLAIAGALNIQGGNYLGGAGLGTVAQVLSSGNQSVSAASIGIHGGNVGRNNSAGVMVAQTKVSGILQKIDAGTLALTGGDAGINNTAKLTIDGLTIRQQITASDVSLTGGLSGAGNFSRVNAVSTDTPNATQTINAQTLTLTGRGSGVDDINDRASIYGSGNQTISARQIVLQTGATQSADAGITGGVNQTITATDSLRLTAGPSNYAAAFIQQSPSSDGSVGSQTISSNQILLTAASQGTNGRAQIYSNSTAQNINLTGSRPQLVLTGGNGAANFGSIAAIYQAGTGDQTITINGGGTVKLLAGSGDGLADPDPASAYCSGCRTSGNGTTIFAYGGGNQILNFTAGGTLALTGGSNGAGNSAAILADLSKGAQQTITSAAGAGNYPSITLTGGSGGFYNVVNGSNAANNAVIAAAPQLAAVPATALKTINAQSITLNGGGSSSTHGGALLGSGQGAAVINVTGDLSMTGGASNVALLTPANPAAAYGRDQGAIAAINPDGKLTLTVGGNLSMQGGSGTSSGALIDANNPAASVTLSVAGATRMLAGASSAAIVSHTSNSSPELAPGSVAIDLGTDGSFTTSTFASAGKAFALTGTLTASGANPAALLPSLYSDSTEASDLNAVGAKNLYAEVYASDSYANQGAIVTPKGNWLVALGTTAAAKADPATLLSYGGLNTYGYQWTPTVYERANAAAYRFLLPADAPIIDVRVADSAASETCLSNPAMCATPTLSNVLPVATATAPVTYDVKLAVLDRPQPVASTSATPAPAASEEGVTSGLANAQVGIRGERVATRQKQTEQAADDSKSTPELKREAQLASSAAKADLAVLRKATLVSSKEALAARAATAQALKSESEAKRADVIAQRATADGQLAAGEVNKAEAQVRGASTPELKLLAQARKADAESRVALAEARLAEANAKKAVAAASLSEASAKGTEVAAKQAELGARAAAAEAKLALAARSEALVQAREAKTPAQRAAAERLALEKRVDAVEQNAQSRVQAALADDLRVAAQQGMSESAARRTAAQADVLAAQAQREQAQLQTAIGRGHQEVAQLQRALASGNPALVKPAQVRQANLEQQLTRQTRKVELLQAAVAAKTQQAKDQQAKADLSARAVAERDTARRQRALQAFAATATASMSNEQLAERSVLRHAYKTEMFKDALKILAQNSHAADLPQCAGGAVNVCVPAPVQLQAQLQAQLAHAGRPPLRLPSSAFLPQIERKVALVIGINHYRDARITQLDSALPDAEAVAALMAEKLGYEARVLRDPTKAEIVNSIAALARELGPKDSVTVYYAGHGYMSKDVQRGQQGYWIPSDASSSSPANWISTGDVARLLAAIPASQVMLVSDSCYSGTFAREQQVVAGADAGQILARRSVVVMSSGGEEPVADDGVEGHSIFAWSLMQALKRVVRYDTGSNVFDATRAEVTAAYPQVPQYGAAVSAGHTSGGDYLFEVRRYK